MVNGANPFVGPRPLGPGDSIFGRDREIRELRSLLSAERIVLLCSPSGAGKSSLISAGLIPQLAARFDVWLPTRVNLAPPESVNAANRYTWSAAAGFEQEVPEGRRRPLESFAAATLREYVAGRPRRRNAPKGVVLIFDQFEEILRTDPLGIEEKREFFRQLGDLLEDPTIWALFALREDFLAPLDPYSTAVPTYLKYRYRIDLLNPEAAREAMAKPAAQGGRKFLPDAVERLVGDLSAVKVQQPDGTFQLSPGLYVEPLQLQVVCRGLWDRVPAGTSEIRIEEVEKFCNVTKALAEYYAVEVARIAGGDVARERAVREWTEKRLITRDGIRTLVMRGAGISDGLDNAMVAQLVDTHLVRAEQRAGTVWYELAHDRLVEPIRQDNAVWREARLAPVQKVASLWAEQNKPAGLLLTGTALRDAKRWAQQNPEAVTSIETEFLAASRVKHRAERNLRIFAVTVAVLFVAAVIAAVWAIHQTALARSRELAARAMSASRSLNGRIDGLILSLGAMQSSATPEAKQALDFAWQQVHGARFTGHTGNVNAVRWSRDGKYLVSGGADGTVIFWNASTGERVRQVSQVSNGLGVEGVDFSPDGALVAAAADDGMVRVLNAASGVQTAVLAGCDKPPAMDVAFAADGTMLGAGCGNVAVLWNLAARRRIGLLTGHSDRVQAIRFAPADRLAVTAGNDSQVILWNIDSARSLRTWKFEAPVTSVQFSPDGQSIAATAVDGELQVWNTRTGATRFETIADRNAAFSVDFSGDGAWIATGNLTGDVKLWQADNGREVLTLSNAGCEGDCRAHVAFDRTSKRIAVASGDKIWLHDLDFASVRKQAIAQLKQLGLLTKAACKSLLQSDSCPGF